MSVNAALAYARAGYPVLLVWGIRAGHCRCPAGKKCETPGKHPIGLRWKQRATLDPARIKAAFAKYPGANVGIMPPPGCVILDIDPRNGGDETLKQLTGGSL